jgi:hypothetical protein
MDDIIISIKLLILNRQRAFHAGMNDRWKHLRNNVRKLYSKGKKLSTVKKFITLKAPTPASGGTLLIIFQVDL